MTIPEFIKRCDAYCERFSVTRTWLSKKLFQDTYRLDDLACGKSDVGVKRLERAVRELSSLEHARPQDAAA